MCATMDLRNSSIVDFDLGVGEWFSIICYVELQVPKKTTNEFSKSNEDYELVRNPFV